MARRPEAGAERDRETERDREKQEVALKDDVRRHVLLDFCFYAE